MGDYAGLLIFGGIIGAFALIGWIANQISEYNEREKSKQRDEIAVNVISEYGIGDIEKDEVSQKFNYVYGTLGLATETEPYEMIVQRPTQRRQGMLCPKCEMGYLVRRQGKYGSFLGCSRYPQCNSTKAVGWTNKKAKEAQKDQYSKEFLKDLEKAYN